MFCINAKNLLGKQFVLLFLILRSDAFPFFLILLPALNLFVDRSKGLFFQRLKILDFFLKCLITFISIKFSLCRGNSFNVLNILELAVLENIKLPIFGFGYIIQKFFILNLVFKGIVSFIDGINFIIIILFRLVTKVLKFVNFFINLLDDVVYSSLEVFFLLFKGLFLLFKGFLLSLSGFLCGLFLCLSGLF